jgi:hypothetical protein
MWAGGKSLFDVPDLNGDTCLQSGGAGLVERHSCLASREYAHPQPPGRAFVAAVSCCRCATGASTVAEAARTVPAPVIVEAHYWPRRCFVVFMAATRDRHHLARRGIR